MFNFFHSIAIKIAAAVTSVVILFSGASKAAVPSQQQETPETASSLQVAEQSIATTSESLEIERLRKELEMLKSGQAAQKKSTIPPKPFPVQTKLIEQGGSPGTQTPATPSEPKLELTNVRVIPYSHEILVQWNTNVNSNGKVVLWPTATVTGNTIAYTTDTTSHQVKIPTFPDKTYHYVVEVNSPSGQVASSEQKDITTPVDNVAPVIDAVAISRTAGNSFLEFTIGASEPVKINLKYNYHDITNGAGAFTTITSDDFVEKSYISVRLPDTGWLPYSTMISFKITTYDQSLNSSTVLEQTTKIADITVK